MNLSAHFTNLAKLLEYETWFSVFMFRERCWACQISCINQAVISSKLSSPHSM